MKSIDPSMHPLPDRDFHDRDWETLLASFLTALVIVGVLFWTGSALKIRADETPGLPGQEAEVAAKA